MKTFQIHIALKFMTDLTTEQSSMEMTTQDGSQNDDKIHVCIGHGRTCLFNPYHTKSKNGKMIFMSSERMTISV